MLFDGPPSGEHASPQDGGSLGSLGLGEEEIHLKVWQQMATKNDHPGDDGTLRSV